MGLTCSSSPLSFPFNDAMAGRAAGRRDLRTDTSPWLRREGKERRRGQPTTNTNNSQGKQKPKVTTPTPHRPQPRKTARPRQVLLHHGKGIKTGHEPKRKPSSNTDARSIIADERKKHPSGRNAGVREIAFSPQSHCRQHTDDF